MLGCIFQAHEHLLFSSLRTLLHYLTVSAPCKPTIERAHPCRMRPFLTISGLTIISLISRLRFRGLLVQPGFLFLSRDDDPPFGDSHCREPRLSAQLISIAARNPQRLCLFAHRVGDSIHRTLHLLSDSFDPPVQWYYSALKSLCQCTKCIFVHGYLFL